MDIVCRAGWITMSELFSLSVHSCNSSQLMRGDIPFLRKCPFGDPFWTLARKKPWSSPLFSAESKHPRRWSLFSKILKARNPLYVFFFSKANNMEKRGSATQTSILYIQYVHTRLFSLLINASIKVIHDWHLNSFWQKRQSQLIVNLLFLKLCGFSMAIKEGSVSCGLLQ